MESNDNDRGFDSECYECSERKICKRCIGCDGVLCSECSQEYKCNDYAKFTICEICFKKVCEPMTVGDRCYSCWKLEKREKQ